MHDPLISVIVPAYNSGPLLDETLQSVLTQTWKRREVIVVDDGSTDDTPTRLAAYGSALRTVRQENRGTGAARNAGLRVACGEYVALLDHDDLWAPTKLEVQLDVARRHPASGFVACDGEEFEGARVRSEQLVFGPLAGRMAAAPRREWTGDAYGALLLGCPIATGGQTLIRREVLERVGPFSERRNESVDYDLWLRIARDLPLTFHGDRLMRWRYHPGSDSGPSVLRPLRWGLMDVPEDRRFVGFDAYKQAMDCLNPGDVVILTTPPAFRWVHFQYAISKRLNVFMEKPVTVDGPTSKRMLKLGEEATAAFRAKL